MTDKGQCTCCFLGNREISESEELKVQLTKMVIQLISCGHVDTFLFGSKSRFNSLCYDLVTEVKKQYPHIRRIYVRAEFPVISDSYRAYLLEHYEDTYYPAVLAGAGKAVYIKRNCYMIDQSRYCVFYHNAAYKPDGRKSGTKIALAYAEKKHKIIHKFPCE